MAANLTVAANKRVRGEILALLYSVQPVPVEIRTITNSLLESSMVSVPSICLLYTSPSPRDPKTSRMPSSA